MVDQKNQTEHNEVFSFDSVTKYLTEISVLCDRQFEAPGRYLFELLVICELALR